MKYLSIAFITIFMINASLAQQGTVITTQLDTIKGKTTIIFGDSYKSDAVSLKIDKKKNKFQAYEVRQVQLEDSTILHPAKIDGRYQFVALVKDGSFLKLYSYKDPINSNGGFGLKILLKADGGQHKLGNIGYKKRVMEFLSDCPNVTDKMENGTYGKKDLDKIIDEYNACIDDKSNANQKEVIAKIEASKIESLISAVSNSDISNKNELLEMLSDVKGKMASQQEIPEYLKNAIVEKFGTDDSLIQQFKSIIGG